MKAILIVGSTGAGKTTYAQKISKTLKAQVYSIDEWMKALYWQDMPAEPDNQWFLENGPWYMERINRCEAFILKNVVDQALNQQSSLLDLGFSTREHRQKFIQKFKEHQIPVEIHFLDLSAEVRWRQVEKRNAEKGSTFAMTVDRGMFDYMESIFESPDSSEGVPIQKI